MFVEINLVWVSSKTTAWILHVVPYRPHSAFFSASRRESMAVYYALICLNADWMMELLLLLDWTVESQTQCCQSLGEAPPSSHCCFGLYLLEFK